MNATTKFQIGLRVADLPRAIAFYRLLLKAAPAQVSAQSVRFETDQPPLELTLTTGAPGSSAKTLNHLGFRMPDSAALVDLQRRLEEAGIATQRQDGVECCYARQTKFWVTDPDKHLWELYIFHEDLDHSGFDDVNIQHPWKKSPPRTWTLPLTDPIPERIDYADGSLDEVHLDGVLNARLDDTVKRDLLGEIARVLRPGGTVAIHCMAGDRPFPGEPKFPGIAALVTHVPTPEELADLLRDAGFGNIFLATFNEICLKVPGMELRELIMQATRSESAPQTASPQVMYRGPFAEVTDDDGVCYRRGLRVAIDAVSCANLRQASISDQFVFFPSS